MTPPSRRMYPRIAYQADIRLAVPETDVCVDSRSYNFSLGGMYLETLQRLPREATVEIQMKDYSPGVYGPEAYQLYVAGVRWRRKIGGNGSPRYGIGVQFLERRHADPASEDRRVCELCGDLTPASGCRMILEGTRFCPDCHKHLEKLPDGKIRECIHRFLIGNVV